MIFNYFLFNVFLTLNRRTKLVLINTQYVRRFRLRLARSRELESINCSVQDKDVATV